MKNMIHALLALAGSPAIDTMTKVIERVTGYQRSDSHRAYAYAYVRSR